MSERMTAAAIGRERTRAWAGRSQDERRHATDLIGAELDRARSEEARLMKENAEKDGEIERLRRIFTEAQEQLAHIAKVAEWRETQVVEKDAQIKALADMLGHVTNVAAGLHAFYRQTATTESDGSHEALFAKARVMTTNAKKAIP